MTAARRAAPATRGTLRRALSSWVSLVLRLVLGLACLAPAAAAEPGLIVVGQSLNLGPAGDGSGRRVLAGAKAYVEAVNAQGGVRGSKLRLLTLNDDGLPERHAANLRQLVEREGAVALLNCVGDASCAAAVPVAADSGVPLVGLLAGARQLQESDAAQVFLIRPGYAQEVAALVQQLKAMGVSRLAVLADPGDDPERGELLAQATRAAAIQLLSLKGSPARSAALLQALDELGKLDAQAVLLDVPPATVEWLFHQGLAAHAGWPSLILSFASGTLLPVVAGFKNRVVVFSSVVPNPEKQTLPLCLELQRHTDLHSEGPAVSFAGLEGYVGARLLVEGLRRCTAPCNRTRLTEALRGIRGLDLGGMQLGYGHGRRSASSYIGVTVRSRSGHFLN
jgi:branched-chain amino acid transport system substrate-binding protein